MMHANKGQKVIQYYQLTMLGLFPLYLPAERVQGLTFRLLLYAVLTMSAASAYIILLFCKRASCRKHVRREDLCAAAILVAGVGWAVVRSALGLGGLEEYLLAAVSALAYFLVSATGDSGGEDVLARYPDLFLAACAVIYIGLLVRLPLFPEWGTVMGLLYEDEGTLTAFLILGVTVTLLQYCRSRNRHRDGFYFVLAGVGFFLLSARKDLAAMLLVGALFVALPVLCVPTAELIKRNLRLAFLYVIILSNMPLAAAAKLVKAELAYDIRVSIWLDMLLAAAGMLVLAYWERLPEGMDPRIIVMKRMRRIFLSCLCFCGIFLIGALSLGACGGMEGKPAAGMPYRLAEGIWTALREKDGTFRQALIYYGTAGFLLFAAAYTALAERLARQYRKEGSRKAPVILAAMFLAQSFFYRQQSVTTPVYVVLITAALFQDKNKEDCYGKE